MEDATQSNNGYVGVVNDMNLGEDGAARRYLTNICLRFIAIDFYEDSVEDILKDMETEAEVI